MKKEEIIELFRHFSIQTRCAELIEQRIDVKKVEHRLKSEQKQALTNKNK